MFNQSDLKRNSYMLKGPLSSLGYDWWWHSFTGHNAQTGEEKSFFIEFFLCNPALGSDQPILGQHPESKKNNRKPSYLMVKAGCWGHDARQLHRFFPWRDVKASSAVPYSVEAEDCYASETNLRGTIHITEEECRTHPEYMCDSGSMSWDLKVNKRVAFHVGYGANGIFRKLNAFEMYWHAQGMKTFYEGTVTLDGVPYVITPQSSYGYADKNWGKGFTSPWIWLSSCNLKSRISGQTLNDSVFDIGGGRPKVFGIPLDQKLLAAFWYEGKPYEYNFSKFWTFTRTKFKCKETDTEILWHIRQETLTSMMDTQVRCLKKDMLLVNYEAPDGSKRHNRLWNGGTGKGRIRLYKKQLGRKELIDDIIAENIGCEYGEYD